MPWSPITRRRSSVGRRSPLTRADAMLAMYAWMHETVTFRISPPDVKLGGRDFCVSCLVCSCVGLLVLFVLRPYSTTMSSGAPTRYTPEYPGSSMRVRVGGKQKLERRGSDKGQSPQSTRRRLAPLSEIVPLYLLVLR